MISREIDSGPGHQGSQSSNKVDGFEHNLGSAIAIRGFQGVDDLAVTAQGEAFDGDRWSADVAAQRNAARTIAFFQLVSFAADAGMQRKSGTLSDTFAAWIGTR